MKNKDIAKEAKIKLAKDLKKGLDANDEELIVQAIDEYSQSIQDEIMATAEEFAKTADTAILASRGINPLTSNQQKFYDNFKKIAESPDPRQALTGLDLTIPEETVDTVISDIAREHPLLEALNIVNAHGALKYIYAKNPKLLATWGAITSAIATELSGVIGVIRLEDNKLSAFIPVPKDLIRLGAPYIDAYVRKILADALACGLEYGAIKGTGKNEPIGMIKDLEGAVVNGVYPDKTAVELKSLDIEEYNSVVANLAEDSDGNYRVVKSVGLIVNPVDYLTKLAPASTARSTDGTYTKDIFPFPTTVFQSEMVDEGEAVLGIIENYILALSTGKSGNIEYSDHVQFLQDNRVYIIFLLGNGQPKSNNDFIKLDISEMKPYVLTVEVKNISEAHPAEESDGGNG
jgi:HK97 family phage major capsid protein